MDKIREKVTVKKQNDMHCVRTSRKTKEIVNCLWEFRCGRGAKSKI